MAEEESDDLEFTPTWVVALVCLVIVLISLAAERGLHYLGKVSFQSTYNCLQFNTMKSFCFLIAYEIF